MPRGVPVTEATFRFAKALLNANEELSYIQQKTGMGPATLYRIKDADDYAIYREMMGARYTPKQVVPSEEPGCNYVSLLESILSQVTEMRRCVCKLAKALGVEDEAAD